MNVTKQKEALKRYHWKVIKHMPVHIFDDIDKYELGSLVRYVLTSLNLLTKDEILQLTTSELCEYGFGTILRDKNHKFDYLYTNNGYSLIHLAYPNIQPYMMCYKIPNFYKNKTNVFKLIYSMYGNNHFDRNNLRKYIDSNSIEKYFKNIDELYHQYMKWASKYYEAAQLIQIKVNEYKCYLYDKKLKNIAFPYKFWKTLNTNELKAIFKYILEDILKYTYDDVLLNDITKINFNRFYVPKYIKLKSKKISVNSLDLLNFIYF